MEITKGFRSDSCRICPIRYQELQVFFETDKYPDHLRKITTVRPLPAGHAFKDWIANNFFFSPDTFHDFSSMGIIQRVLGCLMEIFYQDKLIGFRRNLIKFNEKKSEIFKKLQTVDHRNGHISDIEEKGCVIKGTGTQQIDFFLMFAYIDDTIDRACDEWKIYELAREIYLFFDSDNIPRTQLEAIHSRVRLFHELFYEKFVCAKLSTFTMKIHQLEHYAEAVQTIGPIKHVKTLKYERNHQPLKNSEKGSHQFKNKPYSIAKGEALSMRVDYKLVDYQVKKKLKPTDFNCSSLVNYRDFFDLNCEIFQLKDLVVKKVPFIKGNFFRFKRIENNLPKFCKIVFTAKQDEEIVVLASILKTLNFVEDRFCYKVEYSTDLARVSVDDLHHHQCTFLSEEDFILQDFTLI